MSSYFYKRAFVEKEKAERGQPPRYRIVRDILVDGAKTMRHVMEQHIPSRDDAKHRANAHNHTLRAQP